MCTKIGEKCKRNPGVAFHAFKKAEAWLNDKLDSGRNIPAYLVLNNKVVEASYLATVVEDRNTKGRVWSYA